MFLIRIREEVFKNASQLHVVELVIIVWDQMISQLVVLHAPSLLESAPKQTKEPKHALAQPQLLHV